MSSPRTNGSSDVVSYAMPNGSQAPADLHADIALLQSLLKDDSLSGDLENLDESTIDELLQRLDTADGIAQGVESRLDGIIGNLDGLLKSLERHEQGEKSGAVTEVEQGRESVKERVVVDESPVEEVVASQ